MLSQEYVVGNSSPASDMIETVWLAGAKAGLSQTREGPVDTQWLDFLETLTIAIEGVYGLKAAEPGTAPYDGSLYEALGGYVSVSGVMGFGGLSFPVPIIRQKDVLSLFPGMEVRAVGSDVVVASEELQRFCRLVPIKGPLENNLEVICHD